MTSVFVSYAHEDAVKARAIAQALEESSFDVWFDERIGSGSEFSNEIEAALAGAAAVVVLWSRNSIASAWVRDEASEGRDSGRLIPITLDDCRPPIGFRQFQSMDLSHWSGRGRPREVQNVIAAVRAKAGAPLTTPAVARPPRPKAHRRMYLGSAAALVLVAVAGGFVVQRGRRAAISAPSVALLPLTPDGTDPQTLKLASATREALAHTLSQGQFTLRLIDALPPGSRAPANFVISGHVGANAGKAAATLRMEDATRHAIVFTDQFEAGANEAADLPERIGAQVAAQLSWTAPMIMIDLRHPSDPALTSQIFAGVASLNSDLGILQRYEAARTLVRNAPNSGLAQMSLAFQTAFALDQIPREGRADATSAARVAADRATRLIPEYGDVYIPWCLLHSSVRMLECEDRLRAAVRVDPDAPFVNGFLSSLLNDVGRNKEATELAKLSLARDQYVPAKLARMLAMQEATGQLAGADQLYRQAIKWWPNHRGIIGDRWAGMLARGDFDAIERFEATLGRDVLPAEQRTPAELLAALRSRNVGAAKKSCAEKRDVAGLQCMIGLGSIGDLNDAFVFADRLYRRLVGRTPAEEDKLWLDSPANPPLALLTSAAAAPLRRDPRFLPLAQRVGLLAYWRSGRLPDFCTISHEPVCAQISRAA